MERRRGRPRKEANEGTEKQIKQRLYMRNYTNQIKNDLINLDKMEQECMQDLERMRKDKMKLINELEKANNQALSILREKTK